MSADTITRRRPRCSHRHATCSQAHADLVADYRAARDAWWAEMESATALYDAEMADYRADNPPPTFAAFLADRARQH